MNLYIRLFILFLRRIYIFRKADPFAPCDTTFWVNPLDLDFNLHMNNGRYLSLMDLGRTDLMLKAGVLWKLLRGGYYPVVVSESIRFKRSLQPFQSFQIRTRIESWDEKDLYLSQQFVRHGDVIAEGYVKARFKKRGQKGSVMTSEIFQAIGKVYEGPNLSKMAQCQIALDTQFSN